MIPFWCYKVSWLQTLSTQWIITDNGWLHCINQITVKLPTTCTAKRSKFFWCLPPKVTNRAQGQHIMSRKWTKVHDRQKCDIGEKVNFLQQISDVKYRGLDIPMDEHNSEIVEGLHVVRVTHGGPVIDSSWTVTFSLRVPTGEGKLGKVREFEWSGKGQGKILFGKVRENEKLVPPDVRFSG